MSDNITFDRKIVNGVRATGRAITTFYHRHPIICHLLFICLATVIVVVGINKFLYSWARHDSTFAVPNVVGHNVNAAVKELKDLGCEVSIDSIYQEGLTPGIVIDQWPQENTLVKAGRTIKLHYACYNPTTVAMYDYANEAGEDTESRLRNMGFRNITIREVDSEHPGLIMSVRYNGVVVHPGDIIPINAPLVLDVGRVEHVDIISDDDNEPTYE